MKPPRALLALALLLAADAPARAEAGAAPSFSDHRRDALARLRARPDADAALALNAPHEWRPAPSGRGARPRKGILLVHGLGDSPWSFHDIAKNLAAGGYLVRTVLLPGHGTRPEDLLDVDVEQWRQVVREQVAALSGDVDRVYLGGFSTGANLVTEYAHGDDAIAGLALFSPALKSAMPLDWATPLIAPFRPWLLTPDGRRPLQSTVRYFAVPTNGFAQFYRSSEAVRRRLDARPYEKPVFMVVARHDSVLDAGYLLDTFRTRFTHPASRLVWYGEPPDLSGDDPRVVVRPDRLPERRISRFSHMGILFSPANRLYGEAGTQRICSNGQGEAALEACERGAEVWYADWGYREPGRIHARLTFNPYFAWQSSLMRAVLDTADPARPAGREARASGAADR